MRDLPAPVYVSSVRARGLRPRRGGTTLAMTTCSVLPSVPYDAVGPPNSIFLSRLNTQPTRCPVNASPLPSRTATHDSGPTWFATPWLGGTCTRETYRFVPAHRLVKILERPSSREESSKARRICFCSQPATSYLSPERKVPPVNGLAGCYVSTIGQAARYFDRTGSRMTSGRGWTKAGASPA